MAEKNISIGGMAFRLDQDAYSLLRTYIGSLERAYAGNPDGKEILSDIEARIAELILSQNNAGDTVNEQTIRQITEQIGLPDDIQEPSSESGAGRESRIRKRLYRNPEGARLGGVFSGIAAYLNTDAILLRLGMFLPLVLSIVLNELSGGLAKWGSDAMEHLFGVLLLLYLVLWIAVPSARNAKERLEMQGEPITARNLSREMAVEPEGSHRKESVWGEIFLVIGRIILFFIKATILLIGLLLGFAALCLLGVMIFVISSDAARERLASMASPETVPIFTVAATASAVLCLAFIIALLVRIFSGKRAKGGWAVLITGALMILSVMVACISVASSDIDINKLLNLNESVQIINSKGEDVSEGEWTEEDISDIVVTAGDTEISVHAGSQEGRKDLTVRVSEGEPERTADTDETQETATEPEESEGD